MEKQKRQRNRPKLPYSDDGDVYPNGGNVSRNGTSSNSCKGKTSAGAYGHPHSNTSSKRIKYDSNMKMEEVKSDIDSSPTNNSVARIEIDADSSETVATRQKIHYSDVNFIKVEVDEDQRETVVSSVSSSNEHHSPSQDDTVITSVQSTSPYHGTPPSAGHFVLVERSVPPVQQHHAPNHQHHAPHHQSSYSGLNSDSEDVLPPPSLPQRNSEVPILKKEDGPFRFTVELDKEDTNKTPSWLMSTKNKLYTNINKAVPFHVKLEHWPRDERRYQVRVTAVFSSHQYARAHVKRCPIHASPQHQTNIDFPYPDHVVRLDHPNAGYDKNSSGRLSVVVPLEQPQTGPLGETMPLLLRFMCLCSCSGGINRRPLAIIFTLEKLTNNALELYGRQTVDVRVCACPVRDYRNEEGSVPRQDRRCGRKRGGRVSSSSLLQTAISGGSSSNPVRHDFPEDMGEEVYTLQVRGKKLYDFLREVKSLYLKTHPEYADLMDDDLKTEYQQDDDQVKFEDEALQATRDIALVEERMEMTSSSRQQTQVLYNDGPSPRYLHHNHQGNSNQRIINGHARLGNIIIHSSNNGSPVARVASKSIINSNVETCGGRVLTYSNNRDMEVMESEYIINDSDSQNSNRNSGNMITSQNNSINCNNSSFSQQQQPNRQQQMPQQIQSVTMISQEQMRDVTSMSVGTGMQVATENINNSGASNMVTHHPILSSMKNVQRATLSGSIVQNAAGNQPVLLIYNPSGVDDQLVQTFNARKILYPKMEGQGNSQNYVKSTSNNLVNLTVHADGNNCNNNNSVDYGSNNSGSQEDNIDGTYNAGLEARQNSEGASTNVALAVLKRSHSSDTEDQNGGNNGRQFRHIPISAVAQTPVRDQRKNLCVAKKMPLLKPIAGKLVAQASHQPSGTINVTLPVTSQQQHPVGSMILATQSNGGNQLFLARGSSTHIILPVTSQPQGSVDVKAMSSVFPNMSVVKREPHDEERKRDDDTNISIRKSHSVSSPYSIACSGSHISDSGNVVYTMTGNGRLVTTNLSSGNHSNNNFDSSQSNKFSSNHNMINSDGHLSGMNGHPDSAEMLAAQVLASSMGSRQIAVSGASGCTLNRDCTSD